MTEIIKSIVINASASDVWPIVGNFSKISVWHPAINESGLQSGSDNTVGSIRICSLDGGAQLIEKLIEHDTENMLCHFEFLETPMPMSNAAGIIKLHPITQSNETYIEWRMNFDPDQGAEDGLIEMISGMILAGLDGLQTRFAVQ